MYIAPTLFKIYLNEVLTKDWVMGVPVGDGKLFALRFADDQTALAENETDISYIFFGYCQKNMCMKCDLEINASKHRVKFDTSRMG